MISEKFENCSYLKFCDFENGPCDWELSNQSNTAIVSRQEAGNYILYSTPQSNDPIQIIGLRTINDSYCGISFIFQTQNTTLQVSVSGLGTIWSSIAPMDDTESYANSSEIWRTASIYIDVQGTEMRPTREIVLEMVVNEVGVDNVKFVAIDNITLHPCVDCEAQGMTHILHVHVHYVVSFCRVQLYLLYPAVFNRSLSKWLLFVLRSQPVSSLSKRTLVSPTHLQTILFRVTFSCTSWQTLPIPCPPGTYSNVTAASEVNKCLVSNKSLVVILSCQCI